MTPSGKSVADYLSTKVSNSDQDSQSVTFQPDIKQSGNYSVTIFTPGCEQDGTCATRGIVNVTATLTTDSDDPVQTLLYQTNTFDKYDQIYSGKVDVSKDGFRPTVTLTAKAGQNNIDVVASRVRFQPRKTTGGLNGLFEFDPHNKTVSTDFSHSNSIINRIGSDLEPNASITRFAWVDGTLIAAGNFTNSSHKNIMSFADGDISPMPDGGLNGHVNDLLASDDVVYVGGNFSDTSKGTKDGKLRYVAAFSTSSKSWQALGAGVDGSVNSLSHFPVNLTSDTVEKAIAISGNFSTILPYDGNEAVSVSGFAVWVPSRKSWLQNIKDIEVFAYYGQLTASLMSGNKTILAGDLESGGISSTGAISLTDDDDQLALRPLPVDIDQSQNRTAHQKRATTAQNVTGVITGKLVNSSGRNLTILGGHFTARSTSGSEIKNLLFLDGSDHDSVAGAGDGVDDESTFVSLALQGDSLYAGGSVTGRVSNSKINGLVIYDLTKSEFASHQPPALDGDNVVINSIAPQPGSTDVYVGGQFKSAGALPCPTVCNYKSKAGQWIRPGDSIQGTVSVLKWISNEKLLAAGDLKVNGKQATIATYDTKKQLWSEFESAATDAIPGPVSVFAPARRDNSRFWVSGNAPDTTSFLSFYDGSKFNPVNGIFGDQTTIQGIQIIGLREQHEQNEFLEKDQVLLISGKLEIPDFGDASAAIYNGTDLIPFLLSMTADGKSGSIAELFTEKENILGGSRK